jgi:hypothetical protein
MICIKQPRGRCKIVAGHSVAIMDFRPEDLRNPFDSDHITVRNEPAEGCFGEICGKYHEHEGRPLRPAAHSHMVVKGYEPETTERYCAIWIDAA